MSTGNLSEFVGHHKIWIYSQAIDCRKQIDGLVQIVENEMEKSSFEGIYVFRNRKRDKIKVLVWDRNGFILGYKRLERGRFDFPVSEEEIIKITAEELQIIFSGMPFVPLPKTNRKIHLN